MILFLDFPSAISLNGSVVSCRQGRGCVRGYTGDKKCSSGRRRQVQGDGEK